jgi:hypothetical protein
MPYMTPKIKIYSEGLATSYTGNGTRVSHSLINLVGLEEGIRKTINKLT